jgi:hypothetical protein
MTGLWVSEENVEAFLKGTIDRDDLWERRVTALIVMGLAMQDIGIAEDGSRCVVTMELRKVEELP